MELKTLPSDIQQLFDPDVHHEPSEEYLNELSENLKQLLRNRLALQVPKSSPLRFSSLGKPDRQLWYEAHPDGTKEPITPKTYLKFLYGDVIEQLFLYLAKEAGHKVEREQEEVEVDGITGHIDAVIDGVVVDVKSASTYGYKKFKEDTVVQDDPFGYVAQLAGYANVLTPGEESAWWAIDKVNGNNCISVLPKLVIKHHPPGPRIEHLKEVIASETEPDRCYPDLPDGKSGNRKLGTECSYCAHKWRCWPGLRAFAYSNGPRYLTAVQRVPDVPEFTGVADDD